MKISTNDSLRLSSATVSLITLLYYFIQARTDTCFKPIIFVLLACAAICLNLDVFLKREPIAMVGSISLGVCFGMMLFYALPTFSDLWNHVHFIGGNATAYFVYLGCILAAFILSNIPCFMKEID